MRSEQEINERIEIYKNQIEEWKEYVVGSRDYSVRELYRAWITANLRLIEQLLWVLGG